MGTTGLEPGASTVSCTKKYHVVGGGSLVCRTDVVHRVACCGMSGRRSTTKSTTTPGPKATPEVPGWVKRPGQRPFYDERGKCVIDFTVDGKNRRVRGSSWPEAEEKMEVKRAELAEAKVPAGTLTLGRMLEDWVAANLAADADPGTRRNYNERVHRLKHALGADTPVGDITAGTVEQMSLRLGNRAVRPVGRDTLKRTRSLLSHAWDRAVLHGHSPQNLAALVPVPTSIPRSTVRDRRALNRDDFHRMRERLAWSQATTYERVLLTQLLTGMRPGEALGLLWVNVDLDGARVRVDTALAYADETGLTYAVSDDPKNEGARRYLEMPADLVAALRAERAAQRDRRIAAASYADASLVFASDTGRTLSHGNLRRVLRRICTELSIPELTPNEFRHSFLSFVIDAGLSLPAAAAAAGHLNTRMVARRYAHALDAVQPTAALLGPSASAHF